MEKLPHYNFSWIVSLQKQRNSVWKRRDRLILELEVDAKNICPAFLNS
jgi:hypothetical protein